MSSPHICAKHPEVMEMKSGTYWWCACGLSKNQPFCDGSHKGTDFVPLKTEISGDRKVAWCLCKHSANQPFCDGSHAKLG